MPSNLVSAVISTVRMGMFTPTPSVSVPQMTGSSPAPASRSTSRRWRGSMPAWCTPDAVAQQAIERLAEAARGALGLQRGGDGLALRAEW